MNHRQLRTELDLAAKNAKLIIYGLTDRGEKLSGVMSFTLAFPSFKRFNTADVSPIWHATMIGESSGTKFLSTTPVPIGESANENRDPRLKDSSIVKTLRQNSAWSLKEMPYNCCFESSRQHIDPLSFATCGSTQSDPNTLPAQEKRGVLFDRILLSCCVCSLRASFTTFNSLS